MPYFKQEEFLLDAVASVKSQTYKNVELIVVDDCSPGSSAYELLAWRELPFVKIYRLECNGGPAAARNYGVEQSCGELILPLDADDLLEPYYIEKTVEAVESGKSLSGAYTYTRWFGTVSWTWRPRCVLPEHISFGGPNTFLFKRELFDRVGGYRTDQEYRYMEDYDFWISALELGAEFACVPEVLYLYRRHSGNGSAPIGDADRYKLLLKHHRELCNKYMSQIIENENNKFWQRVDLCEMGGMKRAQLAKLGKLYDERINSFIK
jgi:glycosyltransferase involved in cell wall biosynthesis